MRFSKQNNCKLAFLHPFFIKLCLFFVIALLVKLLHYFY